MEICDFENIHPFVRMVKIKKTFKYESEYEDIDHVMVYIMQGTVIYTVSGIPYKLTAGDAIIMPPYFYHYVLSSDNDTLIQYILHFDLFTNSDREKLPHRSALSFYPQPPIPDCEKLFGNNVYTVTFSPEERFQIENLFLQMYQEFSQQKVGYQNMLRSMSTQIIFSFLRCIPSENLGKITTSEKSSKTWLLVKNALEYIWLHYNEDLENITIANAVNVSPNYLTKVFHQQLGIPLHKYITSYRLKQAQQMLLNSKYNITEVAENCGFSSIHVFSKLFKKKFGVNPSEYLAASSDNCDEQTGLNDYDQNRLTFYNL